MGPKWSLYGSKSLIQPYISSACPLKLIYSYSDARYNSDIIPIAKYRSIWVLTKLEARTKVSKTS